VTGVAGIGGFGGGLREERDDLGLLLVLGRDLTAGSEELLEVADFCHPSLGGGVALASPASTSGR
jgi:hypothetical protein